MNDRLIVGITQGDSNGIGYEVIIKTLADSRILDSFTPVIYGSSKLFGFYRKTVHDVDQQMDTNIISSAAEAHPKRINVVNCLPDSVFAEPGHSSPESAKAAIKALEVAVRDLRKGDIDVLVTAPVSKQALSGEGFAYTGHTEYLQKEFGADDVLMFMVSDGMKVAVATGHIPLADVPKVLSKELILRKLHMMKDSLERDFGILDPRIAVLGLNPHCGDGGLIGGQEKTIITPAVELARAEGVNAFGPYSPDGFFALGNYSRFDGVLAMYHDQGLIPFKALAFEYGVNFTAGLPVVRTSPDHGTAFEIAGRGEADPHSMMQAIFTAIDIQRRRDRYDDMMDARG